MEMQIEIAEARLRWAELVNQVLHSGMRVILLEHGRVVGALVGRRDLELLNRYRPAEGRPILS